MPVIRQQLDYDVWVTRLAPVPFDQRQVERLDKFDSQDGAVQVILHSEVGLPQIVSTTRTVGSIW